MAKKPDDNLEMREMKLPDDDVEEGYQDTNLDDLERDFQDRGNEDLDTTVYVDENDQSYYLEGEERICFEKGKKQLSAKRWRVLREAFNEIVGEPIRKTDNPKLFTKSVIRTSKSGSKSLEYNGEKIYFKRDENGKWEPYTKFSIKNPMQVEFEKAKRRYRKSATKQVEDVLNIPLEKKTSRDVRNNITGCKTECRSRCIRPDRAVYKIKYSRRSRSC